MVVVQEAPGRAGGGHGDARAVGEACQGAPGSGEEGPRPADDDRALSRGQEVHRPPHLLRGRDGPGRIGPMANRPWALFR